MPILFDMKKNCKREREREREMYIEKCIVFSHFGVHTCNINLPVF
jgi:hypothetical protein